MLIESTELIAPSVDDPFMYGQIAVASALNALWVRGARALFARHLWALPPSVAQAALKKIRLGALAQAKAAGVSVLGEYAVPSTALQYGLAATGVVHPEKALSCFGGQAGDVMVLSKPIGSGICVAAWQQGVSSPSATKRAREQMTSLNEAASEVYSRLGVHALTAVAGLGLLGHVFELAQSAQLRAVLELERVPLLPEVPAFAEQGLIPEVSKGNLKRFQKTTQFPEGLPLAIQWVLSDAQINGGLLASISTKALSRVLRALEKKGIEAWVIGSLLPGKPGVEVT